MFKIEGKVAFVTGGGSGIGLSIVKALLENGAKGVAVIDLKCRQVVEDLTKTFGENICVPYECDVAVPKQLEDAFEFTVATFKQLDIVINNAGISNEKDWQKCIAVNLGACLYGTKLAIEKYLPENKICEQGVVMNTSSVCGIKSHHRFPVYSATKFGVIGLSQCYGSKETYEKTNVRVVALAPGLTKTPLTQEATLDPKLIDVVQSSEHVAKNAIYIIENGKSGTVWVVNRGKPAYEEKFPERNYLLG